MRHRALFAGTLSLALLTACSGQPGGMPYGQTPKFQLAQLETLSGLTPVTPVNQGSMARGTETLVVTIKDFLAHFRRVLAVPAGLHKVVVTVTAADGSVFSHTLDLAALQSGQTSVTFHGLVPGEVTILIEALDASAHVIATAGDRTLITSGQVARKEMILPVGNPSGASGGSGGSGPATPTSAPTAGGAALQIGVLDGPIRRTLTPWNGDAMYAFDVPSYFAMDPDSDRYWMSRSGLAARDSAGTLVQSMPAMSLEEQDYILSNLDWGFNDYFHVAIDGSRHFWMLGNMLLKRVSATGTVEWFLDLHQGPRSLSVLDGPFPTTDLVFDTTGSLWIGYPKYLFRVSSSGSLQAKVDLPEPVDILAVDKQTNVVWGAPFRGNWVVKLMPDGTMSRYTLPVEGSWNGFSMHVDDTGHLWLPRRDTNEVLKLTTSGAIAARYAVTGVQSVFADKTGQLWVTDRKGAFAFTAGGQPGEGYALPETFQRPIKGTDGSVTFYANDKFYPVIR